MLALTRTPGEKIVIGENIVVVILSVRGNKVRVGVEAPINIPVHREEVKDEIDKERGGR